MYGFPGRVRPPFNLSLRAGRKRCPAAQNVESEIEGESSKRSGK